MKQAMRHWTSKTDYTFISYRGTVPRNVALTSDGVEIPQRERPEPEFPNVKQAGGLVPVTILAQELQKTAREYQREFLPAVDVVRMVRSTTQLSLLTRVDSVPVNVQQWPDAPHVEFANCAFNRSEDVKLFVEIHGFSVGMVHDPKLPFQSPKAMEIRTERLKQDQEFVRRSWGKTAHAQPLKNAFIWGPDDIDFVSGRAQIILSDIWDYILSLFLIDLSAGRLRVCENPACKQLKYFVQDRPNQKFCSIPCKNTVGVNRWLAYKENREKWNADRRKAAKAARGARS